MRVGRAKALKVLLALLSYVAATGSAWLLKFEFIANE